MKEFAITCVFSRKMCDRAGITVFVKKKKRLFQTTKDQVYNYKKLGEE